MAQGMTKFMSYFVTMAKVGLKEIKLNNKYKSWVI